VALFRSPADIGEQGINALHGLPLSALVDSARVRRVDTERIGPDVLELYERL
jgi:diaminohydroxyphosphoribosylaminopyrimidine deaminase/5-amino-6-(5-phosphoribosylamino)uracil reductase